MSPRRCMLVPLVCLLAACRAGAREGLGPTGVPLSTARAPDSPKGPASPAPAAPPSPAPAPRGTIWKAEYYKISDG